MLLVSPLAYRLNRKRNHMLLVSPLAYRLNRKRNHMLKKLPLPSHSIQKDLKVPYCFTSKNVFSELLAPCTYHFKNNFHLHKYALLSNLGDFGVTFGRFGDL